MANTGKRHQNNYEDLGSRNECKCSDIDAWCLETYLSVDISYYIIRDIIWWHLFVDIIRVMTQILTSPYSFREEMNGVGGGYRKPISNLD